MRALSWCVAAICQDQRAYRRAERYTAHLSHNRAGLVRQLPWPAPHHLWPDGSAPCPGTPRHCPGRCAARVPVAPGPARNRPAQWPVRLSPATAAKPRWRTVWRDAAVPAGTLAGGVTTLGLGSGWGCSTGAGALAGGVYVAQAASSMTRPTAAPRNSMCDTAITRCSQTVTRTSP